ncbi:isoflavone reductase family protein [Colletotrichum tofieldiae]|uniref:Isoflavone reductase family protein n=1 Tax=Colletotrichum tofieldiae TaxID=708197 RepID=A0A166U1Q0_9PEZI|nr:isoflavone reductase family protein [Colletotrichum tofieldiae]
MSLKKVTLVGASGNIGAAVLPQLLNSDLDLTILSRQGSSATFPDGIKVVKSDYSPESLARVLEGQDAVVSMLPIMALEEQKKIAEAAIKAGVKRFIPSEYGSDSSSDDVVAAVPFFQPKKAHLDWLATKEDQISWTAIITGPFFDWGVKLGMTGFDLANKAVTLIDGGKTPFTASNVAQIGRAIVSVLQHPAETKNQLVFIESFTTTQTEILAVLEKLTGQEWKVNKVSSQDVRQDGFAKLGKGEFVEGGSAVIMALVLGEGGLEDHTHVKGGIWNQRLGLKTESVEQTVREALGI